MHVVEWLWWPLIQCNLSMYMYVRNGPIFMGNMTTYIYTMANVEVIIQQLMCNIDNKKL